MEGVACVGGVDGVDRVDRERSVTPVMPPWLRVLAFDPAVFEEFYGAARIEGTSATKAESGAQMASLAEKLGLSDEEQTLALALAKGLDEDVQRVAEAIVISRVSREDVQAHAAELGVQKMLTVQVKAGLVRFAVFVQTVEVLGVVRFEGALAGRSLLGHAAIVVADAGAWSACVREAVGWLYFKSVGSVYDHALLFGYAMRKGEYALPRASVGCAVVLNGTQKKEKALLEARRLVFSEKTMQSNVKRLTNGRTAAPKPRLDALHLLLAASARV